MNYKLLILLILSFAGNLHSQNLKLLEAIHAHEYGANRTAIDLLDKINYKALSTTDKVKFWKTSYFSHFDIQNLAKAKSASYNLWLVENPNKDLNSIYTAQYYANMANCYHYAIRADSATILSTKALSILRNSTEEPSKIDVYHLYRVHASAARNRLPDSLYFDLYKNGKKNEYHRLRERYIMAYFDTAMIYCNKQFGNISLAYANLLRSRANAYLDFYSYYFTYQKEKSKNYHSKIVTLYRQSTTILKTHYGPRNPGIADNFLLLGLTEFSGGNQKKALDYFKKSAEVLFYKDKNNNLISCNNSQALDYYRYVSLAHSLDFKKNKKLTALKCIEHFKKAVPVYFNYLEELNLIVDQPLIDPYDQNPLLSLSGIYIEMYELTKNKNYLDSALNYSDMAKKLSHVYFSRKKDYSKKTIQNLIQNENDVIFNGKKFIKINKLPLELISMPFSTIGQIQANLKPSEAFISYSFGNSNLNGEVLAAFVITKTKKECVKLPIEEYYTEYAKLYQINKFNLLKDSLPIVFKNLSRRIYNQFFEPITPFLDSSIKHLYILPPGLLNDFPFELLVPEQSKSITYKYTDFLISRYSISYVLSNTLIKEAPSKPSYGIKLLVPDLGSYNLPDLPFCSKASKNISDNYSNSVASAAATKKHFYQGLTNTQQILQIFSHSSIDNQNPANSKIYFTEDSVPINELYNKKVVCPLIFLSCCETDIGLTSKNDGYFNFVRALTFAGAKSIASTFWKSDDKATAYISTYFYQYLAQGYNKAQALQKSQQQFITTFPQLSNPLYWGAFKITGDISPLPIHENTQFSNTVLILALLGLALFLGWFFFLKIIREVN